MFPPTTSSGFSLLETLLATALLAGAIAILAQLVVRAVDQSLRAEQRATALTLAQAKLEQLRAVPFAFGEGGIRIDDPALALSPGDSLTADTPPYVDSLDRFGASIPPDAAPMFVRRWSIASRDDDPDTVVMTVCVSGLRVDAGPGASCVWTMRTRQP
jgi:type II secretory pathway pseudopilin PulG